jgi:hypothetical protein
VKAPCLLTGCNHKTLLSCRACPVKCLGAKHHVAPANCKLRLQHLGQHLSGDSVTSAAMSEHSPRPRSFATKSLDQQHIEYIEQLDRDLTENPFNYYSHLALVTTLHQGFQNHLESIEASPHDYELIHILRDAYRVMSEKYPLGETLWHYRLNDEKMLAGNSEERMGVLEQTGNPRRALQR